MDERLQKLLEKFNEGVGKLGERFDGVADSVEKLDGRVTDIETRIRDRKSAGIGMDKDDAQEFSFCRAIWAMRTGDWRDAGYEKECIDAAQEKALEQGTDTAGGFLVPPEVVEELIPLLRSKVVLEALGATMMPGLVGSPVEIPKQTSGATGFWVGENVAITDSDQAFGQVKMEPHGAAALTKLSNRLLRMSSPAAEQIVRNDLMAVLARQIDLAGLRGTGAGSEPKGVVNTTGIGTVAIGANGGSITVELLYDLIHEVEKDDVDLMSPGFVMHPTLWNVIRKLKDSDGRFLFEPDAELRPLRGTILGYPFATTTQIPTNLTKGTGTNLTEVLFGNWADLVIGMWGGMEVAATTQAGDAFEKNQTWIRIIQEVDIGIRHAEAFALINDAATS